MFKRTAILVALVGAAVFTMAHAQSTLTVPVPKTPANDGKQMYISYCAPCHGVNGQGQGPVARELVTTPTNLTALAKNNSGKYPSNHVVAVIEFGSVMAAHGSKDMPVWGPALGAMDGKGIDEGQYALRVKNLESYIKSLQVN